jgi:toxin ParE1/3/4
VSRLRNFAPQAARDLEEAADWIADGPGGVAAARRLLGGAVKDAARLARRPLHGHRRLDILPDPFRFWSVKGFPYLLIYNAERRPAQVLRVLHMARDLPPLLADLLSRPGDNDPAGG